MQEAECAKYTKFYTRSRFAYLNFPSNYFDTANNWIALKDQIGEETIIKGAFDWAHPD